MFSQVEFAVLLSSFSAVFFSFVRPLPYLSRVFELLFHSLFSSFIFSCFRSTAAGQLLQKQVPFTVRDKDKQQLRIKNEIICQISSSRRYITQI
jgi:hypothetical protein